MNIFVTSEDEQLNKLRIELGKYTSTPEVNSNTLKLIEENTHRPTDINQKTTIEDEQLCCRTFRDRSMAEGCSHYEDYIYTELIEK
ncbi:hypothetical protein H6G76_00855 [Nostoc sp. FACHB-152]|uniref:hypothetical protein n=1 Tax=unclassified Nostoc TaxID=2593658 RepID=UPI001688214E|nr:MULTISPECIES: hypothetical protein [unclassified Nostoc]MBD2445720.1 hypothetical protein [Nostoc sp. FACHB-152]MBD2466834.1 hypothetical protein [Nostoc sp. FACHB-145]